MREITIIIIFASLSFCCFAQEDPILFSVQDNDVQVSEFNYIYQKNNGENADYSESSVQDYLELYIKFKLKVERAKEMGLDTIKILQNELAGYRKQLASSYLVDKEVASKLTQEAAQRMKEDIKVSHIFISAEPKSSKEKEIRAREKINDIHRQLISGQSFEKLARTASEDKASSLRGGDLGYYVAPLPNGFYEFENALYNTEVGRFSAPFRSKMGFHIIKIMDKRKARGELEVSHILVRKKMSGQLVADAENKINLAFEELENGISFDEVAKKYSDDKKSLEKGGYLGFFGINQYEKSFEDAAFDLKDDDSYSKPIETQIGYHIVKRLSRRDYSNEKELERRVKQKISKSDRFEIAQKALTERIKKESKFKEDSKALQGFIDMLDEDFYSYKWQVPAMDQQFLLSFGNAAYSVQDFAEFSKKQTRERLRFNKQSPLVSAVGELYDKFIEDAAVKYEESNLEKKYPDFKALMREYEEGILLFEATKIEVWDKASQDTIGLTKFFEANRENYKWKTRVNLIEYLVKSEDTKLTKKIYNTSKKEELQMVLDKYNTDAEVVSFFKNSYEEGSPEISNMKLKVREGSSLIFDEELGVTRFKVIKQVIPPTLKEMNEARGYIIADYQDFLEKQWVEELKEKYKIELNETVLDSMIKK